MAVLLFLLAILSGILMILSLIMPKKLLFFLSNRSRKKSFLVYGLPAFLFFIVSMAISPDRLATALEKPLETKRLSLSRKGIDKVPEEVARLLNLEELNLSNNDFSEFPEIIRDLQKLKRLDLSDNPISTVPEWVNDHPALEEIDLSGSKITARPKLRENIALRYNDTPAYEKEQSENRPEAQEGQSAELNEEHAESFSEFATRKLLGRDYGYRRKYKKGEIFYDHPVTKEEVDKLGDFFTMLKYFNDENAVSVILNKDDDNIYLLKMVVDEGQMDDSAVETFGEIRKWIQESLFPSEKVHLQLIDEDLDLIREITD